jgi:sugar phosphate isomerase/epimerase
MGAEVCNATLSAGSGPNVPNSSREAADSDYEITGREIAVAADFAADLGIEISLEVHDGTIVDNSASALRMLEIVDRPNVGVNPDVKNMLRAKEIPDESWEGFFESLAPHTNYWHCKNVHRIHVPQIGYSTLLYTSLSEGDINYRFAVETMLEAGYNGCMTIEGAVTGDQLDSDRRCLAYCRSLIDELVPKNA